MNQPLNETGPSEDGKSNVRVNAFTITKVIWTSSMRHCMVSIMVKPCSTTVLRLSLRLHCRSGAWIPAEYTRRMERLHCDPIA